jgi:hypothetical protein
MNTRKFQLLKLSGIGILLQQKVLNDDKLKGSNPDFTAGVLLAKNLNGNIYKITGENQTKRVNVDKWYST